MSLLHDAFIYLLAAVVAVPVASRLGLGSVLGYLIAGIVIGPVLGIVGAEAEDVQHFAEFGVVMMLFLIGLELQPAMLWRMRHRLIGLGGLQVSLTTGLIAAAAVGFGLPWQSAVAIGMVLALSSTAIVLQTLNEKGWMKTTGGQSSFSVLLTQDIAVIPMLALLPLLAVGGAMQGGAADPHAGGALDALPGWLQTLAILAVIAAIIVAGRYLVRPVFRFIAESRLREIFTAAALLLVIGTALLMELVGLSPALGTFLAGVVLSDSAYRHELESDIDPFKGLLLGLFFISVGAGIDFALLFGAPLLIVGLAVGLMVAKFVVLLVLARLFRLSMGDGWLFALGLAQAGEFAFVLFAFAEGAGALDGAIARLLTLVVALTMLLTPVMFIVYERLIAPRAVTTRARAADDIDDSGPVVVAGMGRFGQIVTRFLTTNGCKVIVLDHDPRTIENVARIGIRTYYGDATRPDLLRAAGLADASLFVAALDDREQQTQVVAHVAEHYPACRILARASDRHHVYELREAGAHVVERELFEGSLKLGRAALIELGAHPFRAEQQSRLFRRHDHETMAALEEKWSAAGMDQSYVDLMRARTDDLRDVMQSDRADRHDTADRGWTPPPKGETDL